jgi:GNAT superfamily N-acetyltransferase
MSGVRVRPLGDADRDWVRGFVRERWGAPEVVSREAVHRPDELPGFVAELDGQRAGLATVSAGADADEIVTLDTLVEERGIGTALVEAVIEDARARRRGRVWVITTNDNLRALRFYQRRGFLLVALYRDAVTRARAEIKSQIPEVGEHGIAIRDEIELEFPL